MAEKFVIPKAFTKEWFLYVWDYYKYHILVFIAAVFLAVFTIVEINSTVRFDVNINFVAETVIDSELAQRITSACEDVSDDLDKNNEVNISFTQLNFTDDARQDYTMFSALYNKLISVFSADDEFLYITDKSMLTEILSMSQTEGMFIPVSEWSEENMETVEDIAVSLKDSSVLRELDIDTQDMYIFVRMNFEEENEELELKEKNAIKIAKFLLK